MNIIPVKSFVALLSFVLWTFLGSTLDNGLPMMAATVTIGHYEKYIGNLGHFGYYGHYEYEYPERAAAKGGTDSKAKRVEPSECPGLPAELDIFCPANVQACQLHSTIHCGLRTRPTTERPFRAGRPPTTELFQFEILKITRRTKGCGGVGMICRMCPLVDMLIILDPDRSRQLPGGGGRVLRPITSN